MQTVEFLARGETIMVKTRADASRRLFLIRLRNEPAE